MSPTTITDMTRGIFQNSTRQALSDISISWKHISRKIQQFTAFFITFFVILLVKAGQKTMPREDEDSEIRLLRRELEASTARNSALEKENGELRQEVARLRAQVSTLKAHNNERKSMLWKKLQNSMDSNYNVDSMQQKPAPFVNVSGQGPKQEFSESAAVKERSTKVPNPPPRPPVLTNPVSPKDAKAYKVSPAPPPPPLPSKSLVGSRAIRRVPEVMELYRSLTRRDAHVENKANPGGLAAVTLTRNMIGEIENRSTYLSAVSLLYILSKLVSL